MIGGREKSSFQIDIGMSINISSVRAMQEVKPLNPLLYMSMGPCRSLGEGGGVFDTQETSQYYDNTKEKEQHQQNEVDFLQKDI